MPLPLVFRREVGRDLADAVTYYEEQVEGLGEGFLGVVDFTFDAIERYPEMFAKVHAEMRRVVVFRVLHTARDPKAWPKPRRTGRPGR